MNFTTQYTAELLSIFYSKKPFSKKSQKAISFFKKAHKKPKTKCQKSQKNAKKIITFSKKPRKQKKAKKPEKPKKAKIAIPFKNIPKKKIYFLLQLKIFFEEYVFWKNIFSKIKDMIFIFFAFFSKKTCIFNVLGKKSQKKAIKPFL